MYIVNVKSGCLHHSMNISYNATITMDRICIEVITKYWPPTQLFIIIIIIQFLDFKDVQLSVWLTYSSEILWQDFPIIALICEEISV